MKRPFIFLGIASLIVSAITLYCSSSYVLIALIVALVISLLLFAIFYKRVYKNSNTYVLAIGLTIIFLLSLFNIKYIYCPTEQVIGTEGILEATVISEPENHGDYTSYILKGNYSRLKGSFKCQAVTYGKIFDIGDRVTLKVSCDELKEKYKKSNLAESVFVSVTIESVIDIVEDDSFFYTKLGQLRSYIKNTILKVADGDVGGTLIALLTGDRSLMSDSLYNASKNCGITHILVVSGMHVAILSGILLKLLEAVRVSKKKAFLLLFLLLLLIVAICNFHSSAIRSVIMSLIVMSGPLFNRKADTLNSLGFAVTLMVIFNPFISGSVAFLLSVFATFGVIYLAPMIIFLIEPVRNNNLFYRISTVGLETLIVSLSATICILPISIYYFGYFSLISPIVNLLIGLAVEAALIAVTAGVAISAIPIIGIISWPIIFSAGLFAKYIIIVIKLFAELNFMVINVNPSYSNLCFIISALIVVIINIIYIKRKKERKASDAVNREDTQKLS